eukprot:m.861471 g.861471  ORF g.861471 m.861471 type:complete len:361 (-) comp23533_c0_seq2:2151-3233(-)
MSTRAFHTQLLQYCYYQCLDARTCPSRAQKGSNTVARQLPMASPHACLIGCLCPPGCIPHPQDYATGVKTTDPFNANLYVGTSSMLAAALRLAPSKDVFWSSSSEHYPLAASGGSPPRYPLAREHFPVLQTVVAALTAGPVAPGDKIGMANASLLGATCRPDGLLLKPGYPATPAEIILEKRAQGDWTPGHGEVNVAYSNLSGSVYAALVAMDTSAAVTLTPVDLGFANDASLVVWNSPINSGSGGTAQATVVKQIEVPSCGKADFQLMYITAVATSTAVPRDAVVLLGEETKIVPHSPIRFKSEDRQNGRFVVQGAQGEHITVALLDVADKRVVSVHCVFTSPTQTIQYDVGTKQATCK